MNCTRCRGHNRHKTGFPSGNSQNPHSRVSLADVTRNCRLPTGACDRETQLSLGVGNLSPGDTSLWPDGGWQWEAGGVPGRNNATAMLRAGKKHRARQKQRRSGCAWGLEGRTVRGEAGEGGQVSIRWGIIGHGKDFGFYPKHVKCHRSVLSRGWVIHLHFSKILWLQNREWTKREARQGLCKVLGGCRSATREITATGLKPTWTRRQRPGDASVESTDLGEKLNNGNEGEGRLRCLA